jgi:hypothetical protein
VSSGGVACCFTLRTTRPYIEKPLLPVEGAATVYAAGPGPTLLSFADVRDLRVATRPVFVAVCSSTPAVSVARSTAFGSRGVCVWFAADEGGH